MGLTLSDLQSAAGITAVVLILVQLIKRWVPADYVQHSAVALGIVLAVVTALILGVRDATGLGNAVLVGLFGGASAVGLYDLQKPVSILRPKE